MGFHAAFSLFLELFLSGRMSGGVLSSCPQGTQSVTLPVFCSQSQESAGEGAHGVAKPSCEILGGPCVHLREPRGMD